MKTTFNFTVVLILDESSYEDLPIKLGLLNHSVTGSILASYLINGKTGYRAVELLFIATGVKKEAIISYLLHKLEYICFRVENSPKVFVKNYGDLNDLFLDEYDYNLGAEEFQKDLLSTQERYDLLFESNSYFTKSNSLSLMDFFEKESYTFPLENKPSLLFRVDCEYDLMDNELGEVHTIDITLGIPEKYFEINILKKLEKK